MSSEFEMTIVLGQENVLKSGGGFFGSVHILNTSHLLRLKNGPILCLYFFVYVVTAVSVFVMVFLDLQW